MQSAAYGLAHRASDTAVIKNGETATDGQQAGRGRCFARARVVAGEGQVDIVIYQPQQFGANGVGIGIAQRLSGSSRNRSQQAIDKIVGVIRRPGAGKRNTPLIAIAIF